MKTIFFLISLVLFGIAFSGCAIDDDEDPGKAPAISAVYFYKDTSTIPTSNFNVGDNITFTVHFEDPDLDVVTLHVVIYDLSDPGKVYDGPTVYGLDSGQWSENATSQKLDVAFQTGDYRIDFQAVDEKHNVSLIYRKRLYVL
jgi:hypothetical protein